MKELNKALKIKVNNNICPLCGAKLILYIDGTGEKDSKVCSKASCKFEVELDD